MFNIAKQIKDQTDSILRRRQTAPGSSVTVRGGTTQPGTGPGTAPVIVDPNNDLAAHKTSGDHDGRYYTEAEIDGMLNFTALSDTPAAYTGQGSKIVAVKADVSGLEFVTAPPAENGIPTGGANNQLLAKDGATDYAVKWVEAPEAANGLPAGGTAGQVLAKIDGDDYNTEWIDPPSGGGTPSGDGTEDTYSGALAATDDNYTGNVTSFEMLASTWVSAIKFYLITSCTVDVTLRTYGGETIARKPGVAMTGGEYNTVIFDEPVQLLIGGFYTIEFLFSTAQKLYRTSNYNYLGPLWKNVQSRVNNFFGTTYNGTAGFGLVEYDDTP